MATATALRDRESEKLLASIPVVAFGSGLTALGVLRSLRASGVTVYSVCAPGDLVTKSRWYRPAPLFEGSTPQPPQLAGYLSGLPLREAVLFPCSDDWVRAIADRPASLHARFPASVPESLVVETMTDKWRFSTLVECLGLPRPRTLRIDSMEQLRTLDDGAFRGMFLKPVDSQDFARHTGVKAFRVEGKEHALRIMESVASRGTSGFPILLQEYIPGPATSYYLVDGFVDRERRIRALIARQRLSQYPPSFGNSSRSETIPLDRVRGAVESLEKLWSTVNYRGIFDAEFKYDERDGQLKILEINARPWWFVEFATRCRVDLCRMAFLDALGMPVESARGYDIGRRCVYLGYDLAAHVVGGPRLAGLWKWLRSARGIEDIIFRWDDPGPGLHSVIAALRSFARRKRRPAHAA